MTSQLDGSLTEEQAKTAGSAQEFAESDVESSQAALAEVPEAEPQARRTRTEPPEIPESCRVWPALARRRNGDRIPLTAPGEYSAEEQVSMPQGLTYSEQIPESSPRKRKENGTAQEMREQAACTKLAEGAAKMNQAGDSLGKLFGEELTRRRGASFL